MYISILEWTRALNAREVSWNWVERSGAQRLRKTFCQFVGKVYGRIVILGHRHLLPCFPLVSSCLVPLWPCCPGLEEPLGSLLILCGLRAWGLGKPRKLRGLGAGEHRKPRERRGFVTFGLPEWISGRPEWAPGRAQS